MTKSRFAAAVRFFSVSTSARDSSRVMLAFARRKYAEMEYGYPMVVTPGVASARTLPAVRFCRMGKRSTQFRHDLFAIRHLLHVLWRNKTHRINVLEPSQQQLLQIFSLHLGGDEFRQSLPGIARALDELHSFHSLLMKFRRRL